MPVGGEIFRTCPDQLWGPPNLLYNGYRVFPEGKAAGASRWPPTLSSTEVKERVELYLYSPSGPSWPVVGWPLPLHSMCMFFSILEFGCDISSYRATCLSHFFELCAAFGLNYLSVRDYHREKNTALLNTVNQRFSNRVLQMAVWGFRETKMRKGGRVL